MIQRIQSVYLLIVAILNVQVFLFPFVSFFKEPQNEIIEMGALQILRGLPSKENSVEYLLPLSILFILIILIALFTIFLFKNRLLQARLTVINTLLLLGSMGLTAYLGWTIFESLEGYKIQYNFTCIFPIIAIICNFLAIRAIQKDEALIRSANRLR